MVQKTAEPEGHFRVLQPEVLSLQGMQKYRPVCTSGENTGATGHFQPHVLCVLVAQLCLTLCDPTGYSQPASSTHGILKSRILEWVAILFSRGSFRIRDQTQSPTLQGGFVFFFKPSEPPGKPIFQPHNESKFASFVPFLKKLLGNIL